MRLLSILFGLTFAGAACADRVMVFAAASLGPALDLAAADWEAATGHDVVIAYAGSGALAQQILHGAPADIFVSASTDWMAAVTAEFDLGNRNPVDLLGNSLVLVAPGSAVSPAAEIGPETDLSGMLAGGRLAIGLVASVPAGQYGKAALETLGLWSAVSDQLAQVDSVRAALALVGRGEAPLGIVYATDAIAEPKVHVVGQFPAGSHPIITYPALHLTENPAAAAFLVALQSAPAQAIFAAQGFTIPDPAQ